MEREEAERLVARYGPSVYRLAALAQGAREDAEDVMQETFLRLVRAAWSFGMRSTARRGCSGWRPTAPQTYFRMPWRKRDLPLEAAGACHPHRRRSQTAMCWRRCCPCRRNTASRSIYFTMRVFYAETAAVLGRRESTVRAQLTRPEPCCGKLEVEIYGDRQISAGNGAGRAVPWSQREHLVHA